MIISSAGVGRTGTFIVVDWLMQEINIRDEIDIFSTILRVRNYRMKLVQSEVKKTTNNNYLLMVILEREEYSGTEGFRFL